jgi:heme exporter protein D
VPELGPHGVFIIAAYAIAALVVIALIVWVIADHGAQRRLLSDLDVRGVTRRSGKSEAA